MGRLVGIKREERKKRMIFIEMRTRATSFRLEENPNLKETLCRFFYSTSQAAPSEILSFNNSSL